MSQFDHTLAQQAYYWAIKGVQHDIDKIQCSTWWKPWKTWKGLDDLSQSEKDGIIVLKELERRFRKHRDCLGTGARKGK